MPFQEADANICKCSLRIFSSSQDGTGAPAPGGAPAGGAQPAANEDLVDAERVRRQLYDFLIVCS